MEQKYDVFISYSSKDKDVAYYVCNKIEEQGLKCWIAPRNEVGGVTYARQILKAIGNSSVVVVCFSCHANKSDHVESEIDNAFSAGKVIIPFRIDDCEMSAEMKYYLNKKHWQNGIPVNEESVKSLIDSIITNIPERAIDRDFESSVNKVFDETASLITLSDKMDAALSIADDEKIISRLDRLKKIYEHILKIEENIDFAQLLKSLIDEISQNDDTSSTDRHSRYDILTNAKGELLVIIRELAGKPDNARIVTDGTGTCLLYKNSQSAVILEGLKPKAIDALKKVTQVLVVEVNEDDDVVEEYKACLKIIQDIESLENDNGLSEDETENNKRDTVDWLSGKNGLLLFVPAKFGKPNESKVVYDEKFQEMLVWKNDKSAFYVPLPDIKFMELFDKSETLSIVEVYNDIPVAKYTAKMLKVKEMKSL